MRAFLNYRAHGQLSFAGWLQSLMGEKDWAVFSRRDWKPTVMAWAEEARALRELVGSRLGRGPDASTSGVRPD